MDDLKWLQTPETKIKANFTKTNAWTQFAGQFPNADRNQFVAQVEVDEKHNMKAEIFFKDARFFAECVWIRQEILEHTNEKRSQVERPQKPENSSWCGWLSLSIVTKANQKNTTANPSCRFHRSNTKP